MAYRFRPSRPVAREVGRIVDRQLARGAEKLRAIGDSRSDDAIHEARRRVKKVRAVLRLIEPALGADYDTANRRMRSASRLLAPIADGQALVDTIGRVQKRYGARIAPRTAAAIRRALVVRAARIDRKARLDHVLPRAAALLREERRHARRWRLDARGFAAVAAGLERNLRRARRAMKRATDRPTAGRYHTWRQRVKDLWFSVRLIDARCGRRLGRRRRRLEALDGCLGEYHNVVLLQQVLVSERPASRIDTARCLRALRRYQRELRRRAMTLAVPLLDEKPRQFVRRVRTYWRGARARRPANRR